MYLFILFIYCIVNKIEWLYNLVYFILFMIVYIVYVYIYMCVCVCVCACLLVSHMLYIYIYISYVVFYATKIYVLLYMLPNIISLTGQTISSICWVFCVQVDICLFLLLLYSTWCLLLLLLLYLSLSISKLLLSYHWYMMHVKRI